jgi:hypothetical protein
MKEAIARPLWFIRIFRTMSDLQRDRAFLAGAAVRRDVVLRVGGRVVGIHGARRRAEVVGMVVRQGCGSWARDGRRSHARVRPRS